MNYQIQKEIKPEGKECTNIKVCRNCGASLEENNLFCTECGTKIEVENNHILSKDVEKKSHDVSSSINLDRLNAAKRQSINTILVSKQKFVVPSARKLEAIKTLKLVENDIIGLYVHEYSNWVGYLSIENISGNHLSGVLNTRFKEGSNYTVETFTGTLKGKDLKLTVTDWDFHNAEKNRMRIIENGDSAYIVKHKLVKYYSFSGVLEDDKIAGTWETEDGSSFISYYRV